MSEISDANLMLFDSHAHYDDSRFGDDFARYKLLDDIFASGDVGYIANIGTNLDTSAQCIEFAKRYDGVYTAAGIHPSDCMKYDGRINETLSELRVMLSYEKCRAVGEIGLDFHYDDTPRDVQSAWFEAQMSLADELGLPVIVHDREAHGACMNVVRNFPSVSGVFHSFSGSCETANELVSRGWYISFSGVITFKNAVRMAEVVKSIPTERLMIETDCPYLAPVPMRGRMNHSGYLRYTAQRVAELYGISVKEIADITRENAKKFYKIL